MITDLEKIKATVASLKSNPAQIRCPSTDRQAVAILLRAKPNQQSVYCVKCLVEKSDELARVKKDLVLFEDFLKNVEDQIHLLENKKDTISQKEATDLLDRVMQQIKNKVLLQIETTYDKFVEEATADLKNYIGQVTAGASQVQPEQAELAKIVQEAPSTAPEHLREAILFYTLNMVDRKMLLKDTLAEAQESELPRQTAAQLTRLVELLLKSAANTLLFENKFVRKFNPETDIIRRMTNLQALYPYNMNGNLSLSFKLDQQAIFYGFSNYQASENFRVRYTVSAGESKNLNQVLLEFESTLRTPETAVVLSQQQTDRTSAELFAEPLVLEAEIWYNLSMNPIEQRNISMYWGTAPNQQGTNEQGFRLESGKEARFKGGLDDNCGNSTYAHVYADFYFV